MKKVLFSATVDSHILAFHLPYLKYFKEMGYEVHVATNGKDNIPYCDKKHIVSFERSPFKINNLKAIKQLKKIIEKEQFDIIHTHTPMGSVVTRLAAKRSRKKYNTRVIYTAHGFHFFKGSSLFNWLVFYPIEKYMARYTDDLITINKEDYHLAKNKFNTNVHYIPGVGINPSKFDINMSKKEINEYRKTLGLNPNDFVMIFPAEICKNKNQEWLVKTLEKLIKTNKSIHLLLPGIDSLNNQVHNLVKELGLENNVHLLGYREDIPKLLKISDLAISSSLREGLPVNIMEAMYVGLPIIALDARGVRELVIDNKNGYIVYNDSEEDFIKYVKRIINSKSIVKEFSSNSKEMVKDYLLENVLDKYIEIYNHKSIAYLRTTSIINDSRATKEIIAYKEKGYEVFVYGWNRQRLDLKDLKEKNIIYKMYLKSSEYGNGIKNIFKLCGFQLCLYNNLKKDRNKYQIIHACDFDTAYIASKICKRFNKKFIYDIYDYYVDCHNLSFLKSFIEKIDIRTINKADKVIICTEKRKKQIEKSNPKKIEVIHNTPQLDFIPSVHKFNSNKIKVCYVGILQDDRLLIEISKLINENKNIELHIGGFGKYENYFKELSNENKNVKFYGQMKYDEVLKLEDKCDILFATYNPDVPNHKYSAPNKVYEAMALGKPIVVCKDTGVDDIVVNNKIGFSIKYNAQEFYEVIKSIDYKEYEEISSRCKILYKTKHSWDIMKERLK